jgi:hypothetical protein
LISNFVGLISIIIFVDIEVKRVDEQYVIL